jgi:hypothetical protein
VRPGDHAGAGGTATRRAILPANMTDMCAERPAAPRSAPSRIIGLIAALVVCGVIGYFIGDYHGRTRPIFGGDGADGLGDECAAGPQR